MGDSASVPDLARAYATRLTGADADARVSIRDALRRLAGRAFADSVERVHPVTMDRKYAADFEQPSPVTGAVLHTTPVLPTIVGDDCVIGHLAHLECCTIRDRALVGTGSIVLHRAVVESGALVGAGAVVPNGFVVPAGAMALGVPAKIRRTSSGGQ